MQKLDIYINQYSIFVLQPSRALSFVAYKEKCLVWRNPIWLRLWLLLLIVLALIPSIKENIGFGPQLSIGLWQRESACVKPIIQHLRLCVRTVSVSCTYISDEYWIFFSCVYVKLWACVFVHPTADQEQAWSAMLRVCGHTDQRITGLWL